MIEIFKTAGSNNPINTQYQFWQQDNHPKEMWSQGFSQQKLDYSHNNPVNAGITDTAESYLYSSARDYFYAKNCGLLKIEFF